MTPTMALRAALTATVLLLGPSPSYARILHATIENLAFGAMPPDARVGDVIEWENRDIVDHTVTAQDRSFDVDLPGGARSRTTLRRPGRIPIICRYHPSMSAILVVHR